LDAEECVMNYRGEFKEAEQSARWTLKRVLIFFVVIIPIIAAFSIIGGALGWFGEAQQVAREEFGPRELLRKYEWFKDASASLDKKVADIKMYDTQIQELQNDYADVPRKDWPRDVRENLNQWRSYRIGIRASYNGLAAEYNAQMAKFNWRFTNAGMLPEGATEPLPREYKPYQQ